MLPERDDRPHDAALEDVLMGEWDADGSPSRQRYEGCLGLGTQAEWVTARPVLRSHNHKPIRVVLPNPRHRQHNTARMHVR
jgi:hypothetical protein